MKTSIMAICVMAALCGNAVLANTPKQTKPASTTTVVKKSTPSKKVMTTKTTHKKTVKSS